MVNVMWTQKFKQDLKRVKDSSTREKILRQIKKITDKPARGKPLRYSLKGEKTIYIKPYRLIYSFTNDALILLRFEHRKKAYD